MSSYSQSNTHIRQHPQSPLCPISPRKGTSRPITGNSNRSPPTNQERPPTTPLGAPYSIQKKPIYPNNSSPIDVSRTNSQITIESIASHNIQLSTPLHLPTSPQPPHPSSIRMLYTTGVIMTGTHHPTHLVSPITSSMAYMMCAMYAVAYDG